MYNDIDVKDWIKHFYGDMAPNLDDIENIRNFALLWNMFEGLMCGTNANHPIIESAITQLNNQIPLNVSEFDEFLSYAIGKFVDSDNNEVNYEFENLRFQAQAIEDFVKEVLRKEIVDALSVVKALLHICYRLRNNLFHGTKRIVDLDTQEEHFVLANKLLMKILDLYKAANPS
ncbi:hypothetical protein BKI52_04385 [marine bacterium AO1-C]|nr:hypothetical protein BKI52_04385 [marine bacterium AO1-C]